MASSAIKLPPGAELVEEGPKLPPGAELVTDKPKEEPPFSFIDAGIGFAKGAARGVASTVFHGGDLIRKGLGMERVINRPEVQQGLTPKGTAETIGKGVEQVGEFFLPIPGLGKIKVAQGAGRLARAGAAAVRGAVDTGVKTAVQTGDVSEAGKAAVAGGVIAGGVEGAAKPLAKLLRSAAEKQYLKVLHPLGRKAKEASEVVVKAGAGGDDLLSRKVTGWSREGLRDRFVDEAEKAGQAIESEYAKLDATKKQAIGPIFNDFATWLQKETTTPQGHMKAGAQSLVEEANKQAKLILQLGNEAAPSEVWHIRRSLDKYIFKNLTADESLAAANEVRQGLANSIRHNLNTSNPTIDGLNKQYRLWQTASELIESNIRNERGKMEFAKNTGAIGRFLMGATIGGAEAAREGHTTPLELGTAAVIMGAAMSSTKWRTVSAVQKDKISQLLAKDPDAAAQLAARLTGVAAMPLRSEDK